MTEPRRVRSPGDIDYPLPAIPWTGAWMFLCRLGARRQMNRLLRCPTGHALFQTLFGCGIIHGDAMNDAVRRHHTLHVVQCQETRQSRPKRCDAPPEPQTTRFKWISSFPVTEKNVIQLCNQGGRLRWKIENEGFNIQKNGGYNLEHAYTNNETGIKVYYFLLQIACILDPLIEKGNLLRRCFKRDLGSAKNFAFRLLEATRNALFTPDDYRLLLDTRIQIRFHPP